jgi:glyoxylase-like metal-dependent hydrolase (beta-lactamase superfamily II)
MEIIPGIHQVDGVNGNCYILARDHLTVIDTGIPGSGKKILAYIRNRLHREPSEIKTVIITHFHMDHVGGVSALMSAAPELKVAVGEADAGYVDGTIPLPVYRGFRGFLLHVADIVMKPPAFRPGILLKDGDVVAGLRCIHLPGHTPGSIGLLDETTGTLFAGDLLRYDGTALREGPALFIMDIPATHQSIRKIAALPFNLLLVGHGIPLRPGASDLVRGFAAALPPAG